MTILYDFSIVLVLEKTQHNRLYNIFTLIPVTKINTMHDFMFEIAHEFCLDLGLK